MKSYESTYNPAVKELSDYIHKLVRDGGIHPDMVTIMTSVLDGVEITDKLITQKEQLLVQKERELETLKESGVVDVRQEFIANLHALHPKVYPANFNEWTNDLPMKAYVDQNYVKGIEENNKIYKQQLKGLRDKEVERLKAEEVRKEQLLIDKYKETKDLKALIAQKELETQKLLSRKELEKQESLIQKENELLAQKELELANKSLVKNQFINELQEDIGLKEKEALNLKIESLTKQLEFKDKALEDARAINELKGQLLTLKALYGHDVSFAEEFSAIQFRAENSIENNDFDDIAELSRYISELLDAERDNPPSTDLSKLLALNESPIIVHVEETPVQKGLAVAAKSFEKNQVIKQLQGEIEGLNKQLLNNETIYNSIYFGDVGVQAGSSLVERQMESLSLDIPLSPINHGESLNLDSNNDHATHSVLLNGEDSSFSINQESFH